MNFSPISMTAGQKLVITPIPLESDGATQTEGATVTSASYTSSNGSIATVALNPDNTATVTAVSDGYITVQGSFGVTDPDGTVLSFSSTSAAITVTGTAPLAARTTSVGMSFGTPQ